MRPIVTDRVTWSVGLSVGLSVTLVSPAKNGCTNRAAVWVADLGGPGEPCVRWGPDPPWESFWREWASYCKVGLYGHSTVVCAKTAEPTGMPFGLWARMGRRNHVLDGVP